ncbi:MAG: hypothetical protein JRD05_00640 [Deltaproteobacteria bacterium]|nr:hypothetical protein [Deltaproteobacteria bacterium]
MRIFAMGLFLLEKIEGSDNPSAFYLQPDNLKKSGATMSFDKEQFQDLIERTLRNLDMYSDSAVKLLLGTAAQESHFGTYLRQVGGGPALGVFQMEPDTEIDIWSNYLHRKLKVACRLEVYTSVGCSSVIALEGNLPYQILMARLHYLRVPEPLPDAEDVEGLARYWKQYWNTPCGKGSEEEFIENYKRHIK